ncbi:MAG: pyridoxal 5'-phosphate synthase glutaminase subunit PdxT [Proteobacteria bacterium]|nr:pyridoxal 5'-phosphate synthase glutaminase subunit PdxT [Pseudomonadota bacterium]
MARIGLLALQGGFAAHAQCLAALGHDCVEVRRPEQLVGLEGLVLPGGESTTQLKLIASAGLGPGLRALVAAGGPVLATCAGLILAARQVQAPQQESFGWLDLTVQRNAHGRQVESFEGWSDRGRKLVFIRAPRIVAVGAAVEVLDTLRGEPILVRQGRVVGACFHPELSDSLGVHELVFGAAVDDRAREVLRPLRLAAEAG